MTDHTLSTGLRTSQRDRFIGIGLMCAALFTFSMLDATAKWLSHTLPTLEIVWMRYAVNMLLVSVFLNNRSKPGVYRSKKPWLQASRSMLLFGSTLLNFLAVRYLQLAESMSIVFSVPLMVALFSVPILGERIGAHRIGAIIIGFTGVLVVTRPGIGGFQPAMIFSICGSVCYAFYAITTRMLASHDPPETTTIYSGLAGLICTTPILPFIWQTPQTALEWGLLVSTGVYGGFGHFLMILAHQRAPAAILSPFIYTQIVWMTALGYGVFSDVPDHYMVAGAMIVIASGLYLLSRERLRRAS
jgi:drug/metabolite transporter (DMT)-like permease